MNDGLKPDAKTLKALADTLRAVMTIEVGFALVFFSVDDSRKVIYEPTNAIKSGSFANYISTISRMEAVKMFRELADQIERNHKREIN